MWVQALTLGAVGPGSVPGSRGSGLCPWGPWVWALSPGAVGLGSDHGGRRPELKPCGPDLGFDRGCAPAVLSGLIGVVSPLRVSVSYLGSEGVRCDGI